MTVFYIKSGNEKKEYEDFEYSKIDSSFNSLNFEYPKDSGNVFSAFQYKAKEPPAHKININSAGAAELATLPGIGIKTAEKILEYRKQIKAFKNIGQLKNVKGISTGRFDKIKNYVFVQ